MVQRHTPRPAFPRPATSKRFSAIKPIEMSFPIRVEIDRDRLIRKSAVVLETVEQMPSYILYPEVIELLAQDTHPTYRLIMDMMWTTGARVSEVLALTSGSFIDDGYDVGVILKTLKQGAGRPTKAHQQRTSKSYIPIKDRLLIDRINTYLCEHPCRKEWRMFTICRQTINRHIHRLVDRVGGSAFRISAHTFRHSFAIHLILHGRPLKYVSQLLGHRSVDSTEIYTNVLTIDGGHFLEGVAFQ